jgi:hypothetical protein
VQVDCLSGVVTHKQQVVLLKVRLKQLGEIGLVKFSEWLFTNTQMLCHFCLFKPFKQV